MQISVPLWAQSGRASTWTSGAREKQYLVKGVKNMSEISTTQRPRYFVGWRHNGENHWEAISQSQYKPLLEKLLGEGVNPASIFLSGGSMVNWAFPDYHKGCRTLWISSIYEEINGAQPTDYFGPDVRPEPTAPKDLYGFISPDGRYFPCGYGAHAEEARKICGSIQKIKDPRSHLENLGWLVIYHDPFKQGRYAVGTGIGKKITNEQLKKLTEIGVPTNASGLSELL